ncbi:metallophosphoesterase [Nakamurella endophytica]|uniref:metallophosphoesterase n=1 Tax=Nakamurella endophytica TaxID=1748367 RepID=UPI00166BCAE5
MPPPGDTAGAPASAASAGPERRRGRARLGLPVVVAVLLLLHGVPWWLLVLSPDWPAPVTVAGTVLAVLLAAGFPYALWRGHGRRHSDRWAVAGDTWLGLVWLLFSWSVIGAVVDGVAAAAGWHEPSRSVTVAVVVLVWVAALAGWGTWQARRVPRVRHVPVDLDRLGAGLHGLRLVLVTDTHFGPIDRAGWSARVADRVRDLQPDVLVHAGDMADGSVEQRRRQAAPLAAVPARYARLYITGNHEYFSGAADWIRYMQDEGWTVLHNRHVVLERGGDRLVLAGVDDRTAAGSGLPGHGADLPRALRGADADLPVVLLAHQPKQVADAVAAGVDLQLSGHTHGGQIWPFHLLVRLEQEALAGLSRAGGRTQLYTSRGTGFWGPPFRVFAPSEITVLELRRPQGGQTEA